MKNAFKALFALALLSTVGCGALAPIVQRDLSVAIKRGMAVLGPEDALVNCYIAIDQVMKAEGSIEDLDGGLLLDAMMRARILRKAQDNLAPIIQKGCSEEAVEILMWAARKRIGR